MARTITDLHPKLQEKIQILATKCKEQGLIIGIGECLRTIEEQDALYAQGRTKPGKIVTNAKGSTYSSQHQWGVAFDFYRNDGTGAFNESGQFFERVGAVGKSLGLGWGGDWTTFKDRPHLYLTDWGSTVTKLKAAYGTPVKFFATWNTGTTPVPTPSPTPAPVPTPEVKYTLSQFVRDVQTETGSNPDGIAGKETLGNTVTVSVLVNRKHPVVLPLQKRLNNLGYNCGVADGIAGPKFENAVNQYQKKVLGYRNPDGEVTKQKKMWIALLGIK